MKKMGAFTGNERSTTLTSEVVLGYLVWELTYHTTRVVVYSPQTRTLDIRTDGWHTTTTAKRINQFAETFELPITARRTYNRAQWYGISNEQIWIEFNGESIKLPDCGVTTIDLENGVWHHDV